MIRIYLLLIMVAIFYWLLTFLKKPANERKLYIKQSIFGITVLAVVLLAVMGRLHWLFAAVGAFFAVALRFLPIVLRYAPQLQKIVQFFYQSKYSRHNTKQTVKKSTNLTKQEACDILGVSMAATKQEITEAHRKLIFKNHPDRGGSSHFAAQINQAKDYLLHQ